MCNRSIPRDKGLSGAGGTLPHTGKQHDYETYTSLRVASAAAATPGVILGGGPPQGAGEDWGLPGAFKASGLQALVGAFQEHSY